MKSERQPLAGSALRRTKSPRNLSAEGKDFRSHLTPYSIEKRRHRRVSAHLGSSGEALVGEDSSAR